MKIESLTEERFKEISNIIFEKFLTEEEVQNSIASKKNDLTSDQINEFMKNTFWENFCGEPLEFNDKELEIVKSKESFILYWKKIEEFNIITKIMSKKTSIPEIEIIMFFYNSMRLVLMENKVFDQ